MRPVIPHRLKLTLAALPLIAACDLVFPYGELPRSVDVRQPDLGRPDAAGLDTRTNDGTRGELSAPRDTSAADTADQRRDSSILDALVGVDAKDSSPVDTSPPDADAVSGEAGSDAVFAEAGSNCLGGTVDCTGCPKGLPCFDPEIQWTCTCNGTGACMSPCF